MKRKSAHFSLRLDPKVKAAAEKAAAEDRRSLASLTEVLLANHCKGRELAAKAGSSRKGR